MSLPRLRRWRPVLLLPLLLLGGCLWQRLATTAEQFAAWGTAVTVVFDDTTYALTFATPTLRTGDARALGFHPTAVSRTGATERWELRFTGDGLPEAHWGAVFVDDRLARLELPRSLAGPVLPPELLGRYARLLGTGDISIRNKRVLSRPDALPPPTDTERTYPDSATLRRTFGVAGAVEPAGRVTRLAYRLETTETDRTSFRMEFRHATDSGAFLQAVLRWPEGVLVLRPDAIEAWLPSAYRKAQAATPDTP